MHTQAIKSLGILEWVLNTPSHHRVHHGRNPQYIDKNYAGILIVWDRLFGTFEPEVETVEYGITKPVNSFNPLVVTFAEWRDMFYEVRQPNLSFKQRFQILFSAPKLSRMMKVDRLFLNYISGLFVVWLAGVQRGRVK